MISGGYPLDFVFVSRLVAVVAVLALLALALIGGAAAPAHAARDASDAGDDASEAADRIELWTMGPGDDVFSRFGHAALCVVRGAPDDYQGLCANYGTADFHRPEQLIYDFLRQSARFWQSTTDVDSMLSTYSRYDRTIYRQVIPLAAAQVEEVKARLEHDHRRENRYYLYHHFDDNCTTRVRDLIDGATGGKLRAGTDVAFPRTYREMVREGFAASTPLLVGSELLITRTVDRHPTVWQAMYHPAVLRAEVERRLGVAPEIVYERYRPLVTRDPRGGRLMLFALAIALGGLGAGGELWGQRHARRTARVVIGLVLGLVGLLIAAMALVSTRPELRANELLLVLLPFDLALGFLPQRWVAGYSRARLGLAALVAVAALVGVFHQPLWAPLALVVLPFGALEGTRLALLRREGLHAAPARDPAATPATPTSG